jgi:hypothetical protein
MPDERRTQQATLGCGTPSRPNHGCPKYAGEFGRLSAPVQSSTMSSVTARGSVVLQRHAQVDEAQLPEHRSP